MFIKENEPRPSENSTSAFISGVSCGTENPQIFPGMLKQLFILESPKIHIHETEICNRVTPDVARPDESNEFTARAPSHIVGHVSSQEHRRPNASRVADLYGEKFRENLVSSNSDADFATLLDSLDYLAVVIHRTM